jgi:thiosulfate/3-mercaptopyruvate sulfurtransferase
MSNPFTTLISATELQTLLDSARPCMVFDCSCDLMQPASGLAQYLEVHIAGALHADLNQNLSAPHGSTDAASGGRHPLPSRSSFAEWLGSIGFNNTLQAVVYDRQGANYCGRLWWMLKWLGHDNVAVLDGGLQAWQAAGGATAAGTQPARAPQTFALQAPRVALIDVASVQKNLGSPHQHILDARATPRFRGEVEPIDPVAGHIPGALNRPFGTNLDSTGHFKPAATLRAEFDALLGARSATEVVHHCGSGVSAVPNILAMEIAGLRGSALFAGSWSEWCSDATRPVAQG